MSTFKCRQPLLTRGASRSEEWAAAEPAPVRVRQVVSETLAYLDVAVSDWEVRVADVTLNRKWWRDVDACAICPHGTVLHIMVNPAMGQEARKMGRLQHQILVHEVLHYVFNPLEQTVERLLGSGRRSTTVSETAHDLLDLLAWKLVDHIFPDINPEEDILEA